MLVQEQLPVLESPYVIGDEQLEAFQRDGHLWLPGVVSPTEIAAYRPVLAEAVNRFDLQQKAMEKTVGGQMRGWKFVENLWKLDSGVAAFVLARRFGRIAAELLGVERVRLFRDQSYFKEAGGANTPWHQDLHFMPLDTPKTVTMWIALSEILPEMATMSFVTGSHQYGYIGTSVPSDQSMDAFEGQLLKAGFKFKNYGAMAAGDASFHAGWTLHGTRANTSRLTREALVIVYYADGARVSMPAAGAPDERIAASIRWHNLTTCLPGLQSGDLAVTPMNPLVWESGN